jgi:hypothetical protein
VCGRAFASSDHAGEAEGDEIVSLEEFCRYAFPAANMPVMPMTTIMSSVGAQVYIGQLSSIIDYIQVLSSTNFIKNI